MVHATPFALPAGAVGLAHVSLGVRGPAVVRDDYTTNGHTVLWAASFGRLLDPTIAQHPALLAAAHGGRW